jgi:hypothetical protein
MKLGVHSILVVLLSSATTWAQVPVPAPPPSVPVVPVVSTVPVDVVGTQPKLVFTISDDSGRPVAECSGRCRLELVPGTYKVFVHETEDTLAGARKVDITGPTTVRVDPDSTSARSAGLAMGIVGSILLLVGATAVLANSCGHGCDEGEKNGSPLGGLALLGGLVLTPVGWVTFGQSFKPDIETTTAPGPSPRGSKFAPSASFGARFTF